MVNSILTFFLIYLYCRNGFNIMKYLFLLLMSPSFAYAKIKSNVTVADSVLSVINNIGNIPKLTLGIAFILGLIYVGQSMLKLKDLNKNREAKVSGVLMRIIVGGILCSMLSAILFFSDIIFGNEAGQIIKNDFDQAVYHNIEKCKQNSKTLGNCDNY